MGRRESGWEEVRAGLGSAPVPSPAGCSNIPTWVASRKEKARSFHTRCGAQHSLRWRSSPFDDNSRPSVPGTAFALALRRADRGWLHAGQSGVLIGTIRFPVARDAQGSYVAVRAKGAVAGVGSPRTRWRAGEGVRTVDCL